MLTGETGAGKSILLDSLGLALGARADAGLVRPGAEQASVTACFAPPAGPSGWACSPSRGWRPRTRWCCAACSTKDGRSRAFINDQPVGVALLRRVGALLVEVQGQHEQMGLADPAGHAVLLDAFGVPRPLREATAAAWRGWREAVAALEAAREAIAAAERDEEWLRHAVDELAGLAPQPDEEDRLARSASACSRASGAPRRSPRRWPNWRRATGAAPRPAAALRAAARALQRLVTPAHPDARQSGGPALAALERAEEALAEAENLLTRLAARGGRRSAPAGTGGGAAVRAAGRGAQAWRSGGGAAGAARGAVRAAGGAGNRGGGDGRAGAGAAPARARRYVQAAPRWRRHGATAAAKLDRRWPGTAAAAAGQGAVPSSRSRPLEEARWGPSGADRVRFLIATNPGPDAGPAGRIASGGELSRLMLALKVVLSAGSPVPTLVFDEVDAASAARPRRP